MTTPYDDYEYGDDDLIEPEDPYYPPPARPQVPHLPPPGRPWGPPVPSFPDDHYDDY